MNDERTILIIDDEKGLCDILADRLGRAGYKTLVANDGAAGFQGILEKKPDLVILDLNLPKITGEEICKEVKDSYDKSLSKIPIIIVTGKTDDVDRVCGIAMGADAYLTKPFSLESLMNEILRLLPALSF
jgi:two-component system alkaline phosphatase synthesis response regulator PhoP